ncbi:MAG TPA: hypothetical protein VK915_00130 [Gaiellaceae bacterium]|nr:hypothetical protein [Gaiellaceae bacterium]
MAVPTPAIPRPATAPAARPPAPVRVAAVLRTDTGLVRLALGVVALHVADDNYLQPEPSPSPGDHLANGLVPIAVLALVAWLYPRLRAGLRAAAATTFGALGVAVGVPGAYHLASGGASGDDFTGLLALAAGAALLLSGPVTLWRARRPGSRGTTRPPASRRRSGRFPVPGTRVASTRGRPSTSGASSGSSTTLSWAVMRGSDELPGAAAS